MTQNRWIWILAFLMAGVSAWLVYRTIETKPASKPAKIPTSEVVVAKVTIPPRTIIRPEWIELKTVPLHAIPSDALRGTKDVMGKITRSEILAGESIRKGRLLAENEKLGLPLLIPPGYRGVTVPVDEIVGVAGFVKPGDIVDVLVTIDEGVIEENEKITMTLLQNVQVIAIGQDIDPPTKDEQAKKGKLASSVTLAVQPLEAERLVLAGESGKLRLALRPLNHIDPADVEPITPKQLDTRKPKYVPRQARRLTTAPPVVVEVKNHVEVISGDKVTKVQVN